MGPVGTSAEKTSRNSLSRPKFSWDMRTAPWTDGRGPQDEYADAVDRWSDFHDLLDYKNPNKIPKTLRGTMLWLQLSGRAKDVARKIPRDILMSENGANAVVAAVHRRDPLSVVSTVYSDFANLVSARRSDNESYKAFESRFEAAVSRFRSHGDQITIPEPLLALMLLNGARVDDNQRVSILAASVTSMPETSVLQSTQSEAAASTSSADADKKNRKPMIKRNPFHSGLVCLLRITSNMLITHVSHQSFVSRKGQTLQKEQEQMVQ